MSYVLAVREKVKIIMKRERKQRARTWNQSRHVLTVYICGTYKCELTLLVLRDQLMLGALIQSVPLKFSENLSAFFPSLV